MAFNEQRFVRQTVAYNAGQINTTFNPSVAPIIANGPAWFTYASVTDTLVTITTANYFSDAVYDLAVNDRIDITGSDNSGVFIVGAVDRDLRTISLLAYLSAGSSGGGTIEVPTLTDHIIIAKNNLGLIGNDLTGIGRTAKFNGSIQAGSVSLGVSGNLISYNAFGQGGSLGIFANENVGGAATVISNRTAEQDSTYFIPDCADPSADFIISKFPGTQVIEFGNLLVSAGSITAISDITSQIPTPNTGELILRHTNPGADFSTIISSGPMTQTTVYTIPNIGLTTGGFVVSTVPNTMKRVFSVSGAGGSNTNLITDSFSTIGSYIAPFFITNPGGAKITRVVPNAGSFQIITDIDPGAFTVSYIIIND